MKHLFANRKVYELGNAYSSSLDNRVKKLTRSDFEKSSLEELAETLKTEYEIFVPKLKKDDIYTKQPKDIKISIGRRSVYGGGTSKIDGTEFIFVIPFQGESNHLEVTPSKFLSVLPYGIIGNNEISINYEVPNGQDSSGLRNEFDNNLNTIEKYLDFLDSDFKQFNHQLPNAIKNLLERRKAKLDTDDDTATGFGFPVK